MSESEDSSTASDEWLVTADWLEAMLGAHHQQPPAAGAVTVSEFSVRPGCDASESVLSDILAVSVTYTLRDEPARQLSLIVKLLPHDPFSRYFVTEAQFDLREIKFYTQVVPELDELQRRLLPPGVAPLKLPIPRCYHARYAAPGVESPRASPVTLCESVLVLENLKAEGFQNADFSRGLNLRQAAAALDSVARLHALSLALKVKDGRPLDERYPFLFQTSKATDSYQQLVERGLPQLARFLEKQPGMEPVLEALAALRPATKELIASLLAPQEPMALITHTDFWCNNLLFRDEDDGERYTCAVLDWQMVTYSRPTNDVALLLVSSLATDLRRGHTAELLDGYWGALVAAASSLGVDVEGGLGYCRTQLSRDYRRSQLLALLLCIGSVDVALGDALTEQRLLDVLEDLHHDGVLSPDLLSQ